MKFLIVVPCYNEEQRLPIEEFESFSTKNEDVEFLFVDDGSTDGTLRILSKISEKLDRFNVLNLHENRGKAEAVRQGVQFACRQFQFDFIGYFDADLAAPLESIQLFKDEIVKNKNLQFLSGIRVARLGADIKRKAIRHYLGRIFATVVSIILSEDTYDTQCGAKFFRKDLAKKVFSQEFITRWLFDVEVLLRVKKHLNDDYSHLTVLEVPLMKWKDKHGSKVKAIDFIVAPLELLKIYMQRNK